jgi:hypothetical protein
MPHDERDRVQSHRAQAVALAERAVVLENSLRRDASRVLSRFAQSILQSVAVSGTAVQRSTPRILPAASLVYSVSSRCADTGQVIFWGTENLCSDRW